MLFGTCSVVMESHSSDLPSGPFIFQCVLFGPTVLTSSTFSMKRGNICGFVQMAYRRSVGALISIVFSTFAMIDGAPYVMYSNNAARCSRADAREKASKIDATFTLSTPKIGLTAGATLWPVPPHVIIWK